MDTNRLTRLALSAGSRYRLLLASLNQIYLQFTENAKPLTPALRKRVLSQAYNIAEGYLTSELEILQEAVNSEVSDAIFVTAISANVQSDDPTSDMTENANTVFSELEHMIRTQLERDINTMIKSMRNQTLRASLLARSKGGSMTAAMNSIRTSPGNDTRYTFLDRAGRNWPSDKFIKTIVRHALVIVWNETALIFMADHGIDKAIIEHQDADFSELGTIISISEDDTGVTWDEIRDDVFHPNTNAWVSPIIDSSNDGES